MSKVIGYLALLLKKDLTSSKRFAYIINRVINIGQVCNVESELHYPVTSHSIFLIIGVK